MLLGIAMVAQLAVAVHAPDTVAACERIDVSVVVSASGSVMPQLTAPALAPFEVLEAALVPATASGSAARSPMMTEYRYVLTSDEAGVHTIPAFEARLGALTVHSRPWRIVVQPQPTHGLPQVYARARVHPQASRNPHLPVAVPDTVFVGEQADYEVAVYLNAVLRARMRRNPTFYPPDMPSVLAYDLAASGDAKQPMGGSRCFDTMVYRRALFPLQAGRIVIPPAQLTYSVPLGSGFFSREESRELQTESAVMIAIDPPATGQPADFDGAVGSLRVTSRIDTSATRIGDPVTLTVRVSGAGNVKLFPRPHVAIPWASIVVSGDRVHVDSSGPQVQGTKDFDWVLTPRVAGEQDVPPIRYTYFDPYTRRYQTVATSPTGLRVRGGGLASADTETHRENRLDLRQTYHGAVSAPLTSSFVFWLLLAVAPLPVLGARWRAAARGKNRRPRHPVAQMAHAVQAAGSPPDGRILRRAFVAVLTERLALEADAFTRPGALQKGLRHAGASASVATDAEALLRELDSAAFAADGVPTSDASTRAVALIGKIDQEALARTELPWQVMPLVFMAVLGFTGIGGARPADSPESEFRAGVNAYERRDYAEAQRAFGRLVMAEPRAADGWANLGTTAWATSDTLLAVVGWRRALGLEPLASDARERLGLVHEPRLLSPGYVPEVPLNLVSVLMALCWLTACGLAHPATSPRIRHAVGWATVLAGCAAIAGLSAIELQTRFAGHNISVVRTTLTLSNDPALGAEHSANVATGEFVRLEGQQGAWSHIALDGSREGWVSAEQLMSLDDSLHILD